MRIDSGHVVSMNPGKPLLAARNATAESNEKRQIHLFDSSTISAENNAFTHIDIQMFKRLVVASDNYFQCHTTAGSLGV